MWCELGAANFIGGLTSLFLTFATVSPRFPKMPVFLRSALQILFSEDSTSSLWRQIKGLFDVFRLLEGGFRTCILSAPVRWEVGTWPRERVVSLWCFFFSLKSPIVRGSLAISQSCKNYTLTYLRFKAGDTWQVAAWWDLKCCSYLLFSHWVFDSLFRTRSFITLLGVC